jgi:hypothetical protein
MSGQPPTRYTRADDLVWRLARDRVLLRRVGDHGETAAVDLLGAAAVVWVAAEEPLSPDELAVDTELDVETVTDTIDLLVTGRWLVPTS